MVKLGTTSAPKGGQRLEISFLWRPQAQALAPPLPAAFCPALLSSDLKETLPSHIVPSLQPGPGDPADVVGVGHKTQGPPRAQGKQLGNTRIMQKDSKWRLPFPLGT